jgi:hypothetical protein
LRLDVPLAIIFGEELLEFMVKTTLDAMSVATCQRKRIGHSCLQTSKTRTKQMKPVTCTKKIAKVNQGPKLLLTSMNFNVYNIAVLRLGISSSASSISAHAPAHLLLLLLWIEAIFFTGLVTCLHVEINNQKTCSITWRKGIDQEVRLVKVRTACLCIECMNVIA